MNILKTILSYENIVIQCHDNPDADALASGFALKWYLKRNGKEARFIYGGKSEITKSNLVLMMDKLGICAEYVTELEKPQLLVTVDCQYGESNVTKFDAENVIVIDHHQVSRQLPETFDVRSNYGSCATIFYKLLLKEKIDINEDENLATALYYGLMTDTGGFEEISHPADRDLRDYAKPRQSDIVLFKNSNLSRKELIIAGEALGSANYNDKWSYAVVSAKPCDPNILGIISDMLLEVDTVNSCLVYSVMPYGVKISVRSCIKEVKASELASFIAQDLGGGGGHLIKAGGFLQKDLIEQKGIAYETDALKQFFEERMRRYFETTEIIQAGEYQEDVSKLTHYTKREVKLGYVKATDFAKKGSKITIRAIEGDLDVTVSDDMYIIIGSTGSVYPITTKKFNATYTMSDEFYTFPGEYAPVATIADTGERIELLSHISSCISKGGGGIYARELDHRVKVFTTWDKDKYYLGKEGDYLAVRTDDLSDVYVIARDIFDNTYEKTNTPPSLDYLPLNDGVKYQYINRKMHLNHN